MFFFSQMLCNNNMATNDEIRRANLSILISENGGSGKLADKLEKSNSQISQWKNASKHSSTGKERGMSDDSARFIEERCGKPRGWMDVPHEATSRSSQDLNPVESPQYLRPEHRGESSDHFNAGPPLQLKPGRFVAIVGIAQGGIDGYINIDGYLPGQGDGEIYTYSQDPGAYGIRIRGDSMRPRIKSGEFIVAEPNTEAMPGDDVVVRLTGDKTMVKELLWRRDGEVSLGSINASVPPITLQLDEIESIHRVAAIVPRGSALLRPRQE
jgi:phage repressor protein C with HTH and peptisase S24 domain